MALAKCWQTIVWNFLNAIYAANSRVAAAQVCQLFIDLLLLPLVQCSQYIHTYIYAYYLYIQWHYMQSSPGKHCESAKKTRAKLRDSFSPRQWQCWNWKVQKTSVEKVEKSVEGFMSRTENGKKNFFNVKANRGAHKKLRLQITAGWSDPPPTPSHAWH